MRESCAKNGCPRLGMARHGVSWRRMAKRGDAWKGSNTAPSLGQKISCRGRAWIGAARQSSAGLDMATHRPGNGAEDFKVGPGAARQCSARHGPARSGTA